MGTKTRKINKIKKISSVFSFIYPRLYSLIENKSAESHLVHLPITLKKLPLTELLKKIQLINLKIKIFFYFCKKNQEHIFMFKNRILILYYLIFIILTIQGNRSLACEKINNLNNKKAINTTFFKNKNIIYLNISNKTHHFKKEFNLLNDFNSLPEISQEDSENKPFINLDFSISNCIPDFKENDQKYKLGLDDRNFHILSKHTSSSICIISYKNQIKDNSFDIVLSKDNTILFHQIQI